MEETTAAPVVGEYYLPRNGECFNSQRKVIKSYHQNEPTRKYSFVSLIPFTSGRNYSSTSCWWVLSGQKSRIFQFPKESRPKIPLEQINQEIFIRISISLFLWKKLPQHQFQVSIFWPETKDISIPKGKSSQNAIRRNQRGNIHSYLYSLF